MAAIADVKVVQRPSPDRRETLWKMGLAEGTAEKSEPAEALNDEV